MLRHIRSFVRRECRITAGQLAALAKLSHYIVPVIDKPLDLATIFNRDAPLIVEIGFGTDDSLITAALNNPDNNFLGIDVYRPGVGALLAKVAKLELKNVRVICQDAVEVFTLGVKDDSFNMVKIFFPDPWPKRRHHKRRLIQEPFVALLHRKLAAQGIVQLATDWQDYADKMMEVFTNNKGFVNPLGMGQFAPRSARSLTKFEQRGYQKGRKIWDLTFIKAL